MRKSNISFDFLWENQISQGRLKRLTVLTLKKQVFTFIFVKHYVSFIFIRIVSDDVEYQNLPVTKPYPQFLAYCHNCGDTWLTECDDLKQKKTYIKQIM